MVLTMGLLLIGLQGCAREEVSVPTPEPTATGQTVQDQSSGGQTPELPPLVVDLESPLLLDDADTASDGATDGADNMACLVCHMNFKSEFLAHNHAGQRIGCVNCHGDSFAHRNDENNTTPPEIMFPAQRIDPFCQTCHKTHDVPAKRIIRHWQGVDMAGADADAITCTHCHGQHRMKVRTVLWDKTTGKLLPKPD